MATRVGAKEQALRKSREDAGRPPKVGAREAGRESTGATAAAVADETAAGAASDAGRRKRGADASARPPAEPAEESDQMRDIKKKRKAMRPAARTPLKGKTTRASGGKKVDRSPAIVGQFIADAGPDGVTMAAIEKRFDMASHPLRAKIFAARHDLRFKIEFDAKRKVYVGKPPKAKESREATAP